MNAKTNLAVQAEQKSKSRLPIVRRIVRFDYSDIDTPVFYSDNPVISALWVGLSATFPLGEAEFIKSVKNYEDQVTDPKLKEEVADYAAQEAHHSLQHKKMNKQFDELGFNTASIEDIMKEKLSERIEKWSDKKRLMRTVSAEHVTATFAHYALKQSHVLDDAPESLRNALLWHAIEEIEHKSVAFDVYQTCEGDMGKLKRHYAFFCFLEFPFQMALITRFLLKQHDTKVTWSHRWGMVKHLFGKSGMVSSVFSIYLMFLRRGFHPWQHDDSALIDEWKTKLSPYFQNV